MNLIAWLRGLFVPRLDAADLEPMPLPVHAPSRGGVTPAGPEYEPEHLPPPFATPCAFVKFCREMLPRVGLAGPAVDLFAAHLARESGFGRSVRCYNFGNVRAFAGRDVPWYRHVDGLPYVAYMSAAEGLRAMVDKVAASARYARAWQMLLAGDPKWYAELGLRGYYQTHDPVTRRVVDVTPQNVAACQRDYEEHQLATVRACEVT